MSTTGSSYTFESSYAYGRSATNSGNVSLAYSQNSGDSRDSESSLAGILKALAANDDSTSFAANKGASPTKRSSSNQSLSGSSTGGESYLAGTDLLQTITGQPSGEMDDDKPTVIELLGTPIKVGAIPTFPSTPVEGSPSSSVDTPTRSPPGDDSPSYTSKSFRSSGKQKKETKQQTNEAQISGGEEDGEEEWYRRSCNQCFANDALDILREYSYRGSKTRK